MADPDEIAAKNARCALAFRLFATAAKNARLTAQETVVVAAQFVGLSIGQTPPETHEAQIKVASSATRNALAQYLTRRTG